MNSKTGIIELSYKDILALIKNNKNPFFIFPDTGLRVKKNYIQSFRKNLRDATKKISKLVLKNSYISVVKGVAEIKFGKKKIIMNDKKRFVLGPIKKNLITIKNLSKNSIFHISNEK